MHNASHCHLVRKVLTQYVWISHRRMNTGSMLKVGSEHYMPHVDILDGLFDPEDGDVMFLRNVGRIFNGPQRFILEDRSS
jgi:hypothetical protein